MTIWRPNEHIEEDVSGLTGIDAKSKRRRSRRRAWRDGFADQTVVRDIEDIRSYRAFERALIGSVDPRSVLELALVHRLASLLWRLWRASAIETGLFEIQSGLLPAPRRAPSSGPTQLAMLQTLTQINSSKGPGSNGRDDPLASDQEPLSTTSKRPPFGPLSKSRGMAQCFLRLSNLDPTLLDRVGSYEARLWRQAAQTIWTLEMMRQPPSPMRQRLRHRIAPFTWDREGRSRLTSESRN
jgi:hypothetical protein